jgi:hypothetical protein
MIGVLTMKIVWHWVVRKTMFPECDVHMTQSYICLVELALRDGGRVF